MSTGRKRDEPDARRPQGNLRKTSSQAKPCLDDEIDCSEFACYAVETQFTDVEITEIEGMVLSDAVIRDLKDGVLKAAETALRAKGRFPVIDFSHCPFGCRCFISEKEKKNNKAWTPWQDGKPISALFTVPGIKGEFSARGFCKYRTRTLNGTCKRNPLMLPA